jgi:molecular chaperone GrpE
VTEAQRQEEETVKEQDRRVKGGEELQVGSLEAESEGGEAVDELQPLRQELEEARALGAEYLDGWQRARAELANARKRFQREQEQAYANARGDVLALLLPIVDDLKRAFETLPPNLTSLTWVGGVLLIQRKLQMLLEQEGVSAIEAMGEEFDPSLHQALTYEPSDTVPEGHIITELQKGYRLGERVLRPSMVRVSSGPLPQPEPEQETEEPEGDAPPTSSVPSIPEMKE